MDKELSHHVERLVHVTCELVEQLKQQNKAQAVLHGLAEMEKRIMSAISTYTDKVNTAFDAIATSVDEIVVSQTGLASDVAALKKIITDFQATIGVLTPEDQALLDAAEVKVNTLVSNIGAVSTALKALDVQTESAPTPA